MTQRAVSRSSRAVPIRRPRQFTASNPVAPPARRAYPPLMATPIPAGASGVPQTTDLAHDVFRHERQPLDPFFSPKNVAVIGATETENSVGRTLLRNLISSPFGGTVFPVNLKRPSVLGIKAYPTIADVPAKVDLAVIVTPAQAVPTLIGQCVDAGGHAAIAISAGFKELGPAGSQPGRAI